MDVPRQAGGPAKPPVSIVGDRVALGQLRRDLNPLYARWLNDFGTLRTLAATPRPQTAESQEAWYERAAVAQGAIRFTIYARAGWQPIGTTAWFDLDWRNRTAEYSLMIGEAGERGRGYSTEATRLMLDYAFTALGLHSAVLHVYEYNVAARRAYLRAGFREFGRRRQCHFMGGRLWDAIYMDCLASKFTSPVLARLLDPAASADG